MTCVAREGKIGRSEGTTGKLMDSHRELKNSIRGTTDG